MAFLGAWGPGVQFWQLAGGLDLVSVLPWFRFPGDSFPPSVLRFPACLIASNRAFSRSSGQITVKGKNAFSGLLALRGAWSAAVILVPGAVGAVMISQRFPVLPIAAVGCSGAGCVQPTNTVGCSLIPPRFYLLPRWVVLRVIPSSAVGYSAFYLLSWWVVRAVLPIAPMGYCFILHWH